MLKNKDFHVILLNEQLYSWWIIQKGKTLMAVTYKKLWHILLDRDMKKKDLLEKAELTKYTMRKLGNDESVTTNTLAKICRALNCTVDDIMEVLPEDK